MDWNRVEGNWKQFKGRAKEKWGRLTDDDLDVVNGRRVLALKSGEISLTLCLEQLRQRCNQKHDFAQRATCRR
jgi:CsbD-like